MGSGYRTFTAGEVLTASNVQDYLQDQAVMVFGGTAARSSAIGTANFEEGMLTYLTDVDKLQVYTGATFEDVYPGNDVYGAWTSYTPTWTGQLTNPVINNGTIDAKYKQIGKTVHLRIDITMGSTTTYGTGDWRFTLPVEAKDLYAVILNIMVLDAGTAWYNGFGSTGFLGSTTQFVPVQSEGGSAMSAMTSTNPMTWTTNDVLTISGTYEAL